MHRERMTDRLRGTPLLFMTPVFIYVLKTILGGLEESQKSLLREIDSIFVF